MTDALWIVDIDGTVAVREHFAGLPVMGVIEDRASVVRMWRQLGLTVLQCKDGDY